MNIFIAFLCVLVCATAHIVKIGAPFTPDMGNPCKIQFILFPNEQGILIQQDLWADPGQLNVTIGDLTFYLYTQENIDKPDIIPAQNLDVDVSKSHFDKSRRNVFVSHGYLNNHNSPLNRILKKAILRDNNVNLFIIDWSRLANTPLYHAAAQAVPIIGRFVGDSILALMKKYTIQSSEFDLIGHSLGAHLVGFAGKQVGGTVNSIFGLDPAGPCFTDNKPEDRINATDANFVQIIHTSMLYGLDQSIGDADYYPNDGKFQPGCMGEQVCAHLRVFKLYGESIISGGFTARNCSSHHDFKAGKCDLNHKSSMGRMNVDKSARGDYYLDTNAFPPFSRD